MSPKAYTEFTKENADENCQIRTYRAYYTGTDMEQDDNSPQETTGVQRAEIHDFAVHRTGGR